MAAYLVRKPGQGIVALVDIMAMFDVAFRRFGHVLGVHGAGCRIVGQRQHEMKHKKC
jgi:hypothetical protein